MIIFVILFVTSARGNEDWVLKEFCCTCNTTEEDGLREAVVGYDTNLTSLMDPGEGCRWIFKSGSTECCYSDDTDQCEYKTHDKEKCRKNHTEFIVHPTYPTRECVLQLFNIGYKDAGEYTQTTRTFNFSINLTVTRDKDWEKKLLYVLSIIIAIVISGTVGWTLRKFWNIAREKKETLKRDEEEKQLKEGKALLDVLKNENEEAFRDLSKSIDMLGARDKDNNSLLHLYGMPNWTDKKTAMIYDYCLQKNLFEQQIDDGKQMLLQCSDKIDKIKNIPSLKTNINLLNNLKETPLHVAAKYGTIKAVKDLLSIEGVDINAIDQTSLTPLHHAALKGHTEIIKLLLNKSDVKIDAKDKHGRTPLLCAGAGGKHKAFEALVKHGAKLNAKTDKGENILHIVSEKENEGKLEILESVLKPAEGEDCQEKQQMKNELFTAISFEDNQETVNSMVSENASSCGTPLEIAVSSRFIKAAKVLIDYGADFRKKPDQQQDLHLLLHAVLKGEKGFADFLLKKDPNLVNAKTDKNESYLHVAITNLNLNAVILFLNMKIDKDATNNEGKTALEFADAKLKKSPNENKLPKIISELNKERNDFDKQDILENIKISSDNVKQIDQKLKEIEIKKKKESEVFIQQLKKARRDEKGWKKKLKDLEGEPYFEEKDQDEKKRENPTMEKIQNRVTEMILSNSKLTIGQMNQVLKLLKDEGISRANTGISRANTGISRANAGISRANTGISRANTGISRAKSGSSRANTDVSQANTGNRFLVPN